MRNRRRLLVAGAAAFIVAAVPALRSEAAPVAVLETYNYNFLLGGLPPHEHTVHYQGLGTTANAVGVVERATGEVRFTDPGVVIAAWEASATDQNCLPGVGSTLCNSADHLIVTTLQGNDRVSIFSRQTRISVFAGEGKDRVTINDVEGMVDCGPGKDTLVTSNHRIYAHPGPAPPRPLFVIDCETVILR